ncbi:MULTISPECIES: hypothetical protein [unclassified Brevibacillus]|uniref:hypothetical protein n=1 Tax=unclassified Brevibacillus TaxID=2684853 RepID=UPI003561B910
MRREDTISYNRYINEAPDNEVWRPITSTDEVQEFDKLLQAVERSFTSNNKKEKGDALESLMTFVYDRFECAIVRSNVIQGDNQIDHLIEFVDATTPSFIHNYIGLRIIGESKNHKKSIDVREVADLAELLRSKRARLGVFSSAKSFSCGKKNNYWQFAEGKRRKLALARNEFVIGITFDEIKTLKTNNFYTIIRQKFFNLIDEVNDDFIDYLEDSISESYPRRLLVGLDQLQKNGILTEDEYQIAKKRLSFKYGEVFQN